MFAHNEMNMLILEKYIWKDVDGDDVIIMAEISENPFLCKNDAYAKKSDDHKRDVMPL